MVLQVVPSVVPSVVRFAIGRGGQPIGFPLEGLHEDELQPEISVEEVVQDVHTGLPCQTGRPSGHFGSPV